ncbi:hypothetical protein CspeluHIS016_0501110 [Cutaneotrichosporon spelunceum]|uniref:F-box domain-containing protein n=1 Tax=Cutaneotrichosporon spelunceum TaxID=1672016 RepID=A0AAD3TWF0_9TREE|nr:hypothetical protein CspeluHIS016_0501110 [Cutaneotrichosporon spelunceum]
MLKHFKKPRPKPAPGRHVPPTAGMPPKREHPLDHTAFPHVFERVLLHAPHRSLLRLRATCRTLRDSIDRAMATHLFQIQDERHAPLPFGCATFPALAGMHSRHPAFAPTPLLPKLRKCRLLRGHEPPQRPPKTPAGQLELLASATVIDLMFAGAQSVSGLSSDISGAADLHKLRLRGIRLWRHDVQTDVNLTSIPASTRIVFWWPAPIPRPISVGKDWPKARRNYGRGPKRTVLNCSVQDRHDPHLWSWMWLSQELVLVLVDHGVREADGDPMPKAGAGLGGGTPPISAVSRTPPAIDIATESTEEPSDTIWRAILQDIVLPVVNATAYFNSESGPTGTVVVVNADALPPLDTVRWKLFFPEHQFAGLRDVLQPYETLGSLMTLVTTHYAKPAWQVSFRTLEEHRAHVGEEQFRLETDEAFVLRDYEWLNC